MSIIIVRRIDNFNYSFRESDRNGKLFVAKTLTFEIPNDWAIKKFHKFNKEKETFRIGMLFTLEEAIAETEGKIKYTKYDYEYPDITDEIDDRLKGKWEHQSEAVHAFMNRRFGIIQVPTRGGKTYILSEIVRLFLKNENDGNFLFVVDTGDLFAQAFNDLTEYFKAYGGIKIGRITEGVVDISNRVTFATIQTIQSKIRGKGKNRSSMIRFLKSLKFLAVDEVHDNSSNARLAIYKKCTNLEYQLCLSATPYKSESFEQNLKLREWSGDIIYKISERTLRDRGVLSEYKVFLLMIDHNEINYNIEIESYDEYKNKLILDNDIRDKYFMIVLEILKKHKIKTLAIFQSIPHGNKLSELTGSPFISGINKIEERLDEMKTFLSSGDVLFASGIFKKGITLPEAQVIINVDGGLEKANVIQKKGRVLGTTKLKNKSLVVDFIDISDFYFSKHSASRLNAYVEDIGEDNIGILDVTADDWSIVIEKWILEWLRGQSASISKGQ